MIYKLVVSIVGWFLLLWLQGPEIITLFGIKIFPVIGVVGSILYSMFPKTFDMGVSGWNSSSIIDKVMPVLVVVVCLYLSKYVKDTVIVVCVRSFYFGALFPYIGKAIFIKEG